MTILRVYLTVAALLASTLLSGRASAADEAERNLGRVDGTVTWKHVAAPPGSTESVVVTVTAQGTWRIPPNSRNHRCMDGPSDDGWVTYIGLEGSLHYEKVYTDKVDLKEYDLDDPNVRASLEQRTGRRTTIADKPVRIPFEEHERGVYVSAEHAILGCLHVHAKKRKLMFSSPRFNTANNGLQPSEYSYEAVNVFGNPLQVTKRAQSFTSGDEFEDAWTPGTRTAENTFEPKVDEEQAQFMKENGERRSISYSFTFFDQNPELVVLVDRWGEWLPRPPAELGQPGNKLFVAAELRTPAGKLAPVGAQRIEFRLEEVSSEPGLSLNWPPGAKDAQPDLDFRQEENQDLEVSSKHLAVTRKPNVNSAKATITAYDGGAYGTLVVTATLIDGTKVTGKLAQERNRTRIPIPRRADGSKIAAKWLERELKGRGSTREDADDEALPEGDGSKGDGLSLYEEYRGIHTGDPELPWIQLNPLVKDLVVENRIGAVAKGGIDLFNSATQLAVRAVARGYLPESRVVNVNGGATPQHGLRIEWDDGTLAKESADNAGGAIRNGRLASSGSIQSPRDCDAVMLSRKFAPPEKPAKPKQKPTTCEEDPRWHQANFNAFLAHELGHGVGLGHHGIPSGVGAKQFTAYSAAFDRAGTPLTSMRYQADAPFKGDTACKGTKPSAKCWESTSPRGAIGTRRNDASGDLECIMAYRTAYTWMFDADANSLHEVPTCLMPQPKRLCTSGTGTSLNARGFRSVAHAPDRWFGDAAVSKPCSKNLRLKPH